MNFLAHLFLSANRTSVLTGNFIADAVKGSRYKDFPAEVAKGITLHRHIDSFTDSHPLVLQSSRRLHKKYSKYSAVIVDLYYDHLLAANWESFSSETLDKFALGCYQALESQYSLMPEKMQLTFYYMKKHHWLESYQTVEGISQALSGMARRASFVSNMEKAGKDLLQDYELYNEEFKGFFPELKQYSEEFLKFLDSEGQM